MKGLVERTIALVLASLAIACSSGDRIKQIDARADMGDTDGGRLAVDAETVEPPVLIDTFEWLDQMPIETRAPDLMCEAGPAGFGCPCVGNVDCASGWCVLHLAEQVCTKTCVEECPDGWSCEETQGGTDTVYVCKSLFPSLCLPCELSVQCEGKAARCVDYGGPAGSFCGAACNNGEAGDLTPCPAGYECLEGTTTEGQEAAQCVSLDVECACTAYGVADQAQSGCYLTNDFGTCAGFRVCSADGLTDCDAAAPEAEVCDGIDNDCNGTTDEDVDCGDDNECTDDVCNGTDGCDQVLLSGVPCFDDDACTDDDHCEAGVCIGLEKACNDGNVCTDDDCDPAEGCSHVDNQAECDDDGNTCTLNLCEDGLCMHPPVEDGNACNDGDPCSPDDECIDGICTWKSIDPDCVPCGDGKCVYTESVTSCPEDCGPCGDGVCGIHENGPGGGTCPKDCLTPCGNGICEGGESADTCKVDCGGCGDAYCGLNETHDKCPGDCLAGCGNGQCESGETTEICPVDCMPPCGDGVCEKPEGPLVCPVDCGSCGDGICGKDEDKLSCSQDCTAACGNGKCEGGEQMDDCPVDCGYCGDGVCGFNESGSGCPFDCWLSCGDGACQPPAENEGNCPADCVPDKDKDGINDDQDNCVYIANPFQDDFDLDLLGDSCDPDDDNDGDLDYLDCQPFNPEVHHLQAEMCNGQDDNCVAGSDEEGADGCTVYYLDLDDDGWGVESKSKCLCATDELYAAQQVEDCKPFDPEINPAAPEICDGIDNNCDGKLDDEATCTDAVDCTADQCLGPAGCKHVPINESCDDDNPCTNDWCDLAAGCQSQSTPDGTPCSNKPFWVCKDGECTLTCGNGIQEDGEDCYTCPKDSAQCLVCSPPCDPQLEACVLAEGGAKACVARLVQVGEGEFWMGCNIQVDDQCESDEHPYHEVALDAYRIDVTEVTNGQYMEFLNASGNLCDGQECVDADDETLQLQESGGVWSLKDPEYQHLPVVQVTWHGASGYCQWAGKDLCSEAQWEKAARGDCKLYQSKNLDCELDSYKYPWGNEDSNCSLANKSGCLGYTTPVGAYSASVHYGLYDMGGNVWEWVADRYGSDYYAASSPSDPPGPDDGPNRVLRGGSFDSSGYDNLRVSIRYDNHPSGTTMNLGFRCCAPVCVDSGCEGKECGSNGCGGACGICGDGQECNAGLCEPLVDYTCADMMLCGTACGFSANCTLGCYGAGSEQSKALFNAHAMCLVTECGFNITPPCMLTASTGACASAYNECIADD